MVETSTSVSSCSSSSQSSIQEVNDTEFVPVLSQSGRTTDDTVTISDRDSSNDNKRVITLSTDTEIELTSESEQVPVITSDPATWPAHIMHIHRDELILKGPTEYSKEDRDYPKNNENGHFSNQSRYRILKNGERISRRWLIYSEKSYAVYCFCCRLFNPSSKSSFGQAMGFNNWKNLTDRLMSHELSPDHFKILAEWFEAEKELKETPQLTSTS